jgi:hypothetical protein
LWQYWDGSSWQWLDGHLNMSSQTLYDARAGAEFSVPVRTHVAYFVFSILKWGDAGQWHYQNLGTCQL